MKILINKIEEYLKHKKEAEEEYKKNDIFVDIINEPSAIKRKEIIRNEWEKISADIKSKEAEGYIIDYDPFFAESMMSFFIDQYKIHIYKKDKEEWDYDEMSFCFDEWTPSIEKIMDFFYDENVACVELYGELYYYLPPEEILKIAR